VARVLVIAFVGDARDTVVAAFDEAGHQVENAEPKDSAVTHAKTSQPDVMCVDLGDQPAFGREVARVLAKTKATRDIPMVLYGVDAETEPRARTAAPRAVLISQRAPKAVMVAVKKALSNRIRDYDDEDV
jgi:CheY-like chemotaxis protein